MEIGGVEIRPVEIVSANGLAVCHSRPGREGARLPGESIKERIRSVGPRCGKAACGQVLRKWEVSTLCNAETAVFPRPKCALPHGLGACFVD